MSIAVNVGRKHFNIGEAALLKAWFSSIFVRAEGGKWGTKYPVVMRDFYSGNLTHDKAREALKELDAIRKALSDFAPTELVWDFENPSARPPWGSEISPHINSLGNYFVTSDGRDLMEVIEEAFTNAAETQKDAVIR